MKFLLYAILVLLLVTAIVGFILFGGPSGSRISLEFSDLGEVVAGQSFATEVSFSNNTDEVLKNARLSITLPDDVYFVGESEEQRVIEKIVGDIGPASLGKESFNLVATYHDESVREIKARLVYSAVSNERVAFETLSSKEFKTGRSAVNLEFEAPESVFSGENFEVKVKYRNAAGKNLKGLTLRADYPAVFKFDESTVKPDQGNNVWENINLNLDEEREFVIKGSMIGEQGSSFDLKFSVLADISGQNYLMTENLATIKVSEAPLTVSVSVVGVGGVSIPSSENSPGGYVTVLSDSLRYQLTYKNNAQAVFKNVNLKVKLAGEMFDFTSLKSDGSFNFFDKTITWTSGNVAKLSEIGPGDGGEVFFDIKVKDNFNIKRLSDKNYTLKTEAQIDSASLPEGFGGSKLISVDKLETKVAGGLSIESKGYFRDAASGILNKGNFPPKVGGATQFTVHLQVLGLAADVSGVEAVVPLASGIKWTGVVKSNSGGDPIYDSVSNKVSWKIDRVLANKGVVGEPIEAIFQIEFIPTISQVGQVVNLLGEASVKGEDMFAGVVLSDTDDKIDLNLPDDATVAGSPKTVQP